MAERKNMTALRWLEKHHPDIYQEYKEYDLKRRRERALAYDRISRAEAKLEKLQSAGE